MSENFVEKKFLYLLLFSTLLHGGIFAVLLNMKPEMIPGVKEPLMVDLEGIPAFVPPKTPSPPVERHGENWQRVEKEMAPKGDSLREKPAPTPAIPSGKPPASAAETKGYSRLPSGEQAVPDVGRSSAEELFKKRGQQKAPDMSTLYPGADRMAKLEESYRKRYSSEVAEGDTRFLNTDDIQFGSFLRRFENSVYGVWRYPVEAAKLGIEGITLVKITFNRRGEVVGRELLQSSGSKILDSEVLRTLDRVGPVGAFPKGYEKDTFKLIAFFHYGITQGAIRSLR